MAELAVAPEWAGSLDAVGLLDAAARLPDTATANDLRPLVEGVEAIAAQLDVDQARAALSPAVPRMLLRRHPGGPVLALRWFAPGEVSTVHHHAWTVLVGLAGVMSFERWADGSRGAGATLRGAELVGAGAPVCIGEGELHRQAAGAEGSLELVLLGHYGSDHPTVDVDPTPESARTAELIRRFVSAFGSSDADAVAALCPDDVVVDANVPHWRFQVQGQAALADTLRTAEFAPGYRLTEWRATPTADGAVIELECRMTHDGEERLAREVHLLQCDADGRIARHTLYCTGTWNAETIERQARDATMVER